MGLLEITFFKIFSGFCVKSGRTHGMTDSFLLYIYRFCLIINFHNFDLNSISGLLSFIIRNQFQKSISEINKQNLVAVCARRTLYEWIEVLVKMKVHSRIWIGFVSHSNEETFCSRSDHQMALVLQSDNFLLKLISIVVVLLKSRHFKNVY